MPPAISAFCLKSCWILERRECAKAVLSEALSLGEGLVTHGGGLVGGALLGTSVRGVPMSGLQNLVKD